MPDKEAKQEESYAKLISLVEQYNSRIKWDVEFPDTAGVLMQATVKEKHFKAGVESIWDVRLIVTIDSPVSRRLPKQDNEPYMKLTATILNEGIKHDPVRIQLLDLPEYF